MDPRRLRRAALALTAAYAVALQALLAAFVAVPAVPAFMAVLCSGNLTDGHPLQQHDAPCAAACTALAQGAAAPPPAVLVALATPVPVIPLVALDGPLALLAGLGPQAPRGPPPA
jgi:hypothetical protein